MPPDPTYVTTHIHTDGPIPGPHSLLTLTSAAYSADGRPISTFAANVRELPGATLHPTALQDWRRRADDWLSTRRATRPPALAMADYATWIDTIPGTPTFVADTALPDYVFVYWYLHRFTGHWPFARTCTEVRPLRRVQICTLGGCRRPAMALAATS